LRLGKLTVGRASAPELMSNKKKRSDTTQRTKTVGARSPAERLEPGRAPSRPRGLEAKEPSRVVSGTVRFASTLLTVSLVSMVLLSGLGFAIYHQYETQGPLTETRRIIIPPGEGKIAIAERLEKDGIISNRWTFVGGLLMQQWSSASAKRPDLKAGEYELKAGASMRQVLDTLSQGKSILYKVTMPEGLTSQQIVERLKADNSLTGDITTVPAEGTLLPDTYMFSKGTSRQEILDRMQADMKAYMAQLWDKRAADLPLRTPEEAVTLASIVEKETGQSDERTKVSAVFFNRLKKGMRLQSDPTIIYGIVGGAGSLGRGITRSDIDTKTAYNTYQINGLPPGPIANPGKQSLDAVFSPAKTADLYFVADGTGGHVFSETLKDHNSAVQKWREAEKQNKKDDAAAKADEPDPDVAPIPSTRTINVTTEPVAGDAKTEKDKKASSGKTDAVKPDAKATQKPAAKTADKPAAKADEKKTEAKKTEAKKTDGKTASPAEPKT
jgi:UPF0755 protein